MAWPEGIVRFGGTRHNSTPVCGQSNVVQPIYKSCWMPVCCCCSTFRTQTFHSSFAVFAIRTINSAAFWRPLLLCAGGDSSAFFQSALWNRTQCQCYWMPSGWMGIKGECGWKPTTTTTEHFIKPFIIIIRITESSSSSCTGFHHLTLCLRVTAESQKHFLLSPSKTKTKRQRIHIVACK